MVNAWIVGLLGIWMAISPFFSMTLTGNAWNDGVVGVIVAVLGFSMASSHAWQRTLAGVVGLWLLASAFPPGLRLGSGMMTNDIIMGVLLIIAGFSATGRHAPMVAPPRGAH
jgi:uncharacterized membrane protein YqaE (UPF0057 family)